MPTPLDGIIENGYHPFRAPHSDFRAEISTPTKFCITGYLGSTPTDFMVIPVHPGDRSCTPVTPGRSPVKYWTPAGAVRKGVVTFVSFYGNQKLYVSTKN